MKKLLLSFAICFASINVFADDKELTLSAVDAVKLAGHLVDNGDYQHAMQILTKMPTGNSLPVEIERWYLMAQIAQRNGDYDNAIKIYQKILDDQPDLVRIRYELALCYMAKKQWYRADYNLRLAMAGNDIPDEIKKRMMYYRYLARKNKNWNVWFNFGAAPDNNINQAVGGNECVKTEYGMFCRNLQEPESAVGYNLTLGGNYQFVLSEKWRWKNEGMLYTNVYDKHDYDDLYLMASTGPRYVWERGDVWLAAVAARRWYGWDNYNWSYGGKLDTNYDWSRRVSSGIQFRVMNNRYDYEEYGSWLNGQTYSMYPHLTLSLDSTKYVILRGNLDRETAAQDAYANWRYGFGVGFGAQLTYGFNVYFEPWFNWTNYDGEKYFVKNNVFTSEQEHDFTQRYSLSVSNNKFDTHGFVPMITFSYAKRDSNVHTREYEKYTVEFTMQQRF